MPGGIEFKVSILNILPASSATVYEPRLSLSEYIGASLCALRLEAGLSRSEVAARLAISTMELATVERGETFTPIDLLNAVSAFHATTLADLEAEYRDYCSCIEAHTHPKERERRYDNVITLTGRCRA